MKQYGIMVPGSVVTKATAPAYLKRTAARLLDGLTMEKSKVLDEIEARIVSAGFLTWSQCEEIEIAALLEQGEEGAQQ